MSDIHEKISEVGKGGNLGWEDSIRAGPVTAAQLQDWHDGVPRNKGIFGKVQ